MPAGLPRRHRRFWGRCFGPGVFTHARSGALWTVVGGARRNASTTPCVPTGAKGVMAAMQSPGTRSQDDRRGCVITCRAPSSVAADDAVEVVSVAPIACIASRASAAGGGKSLRSFAQIGLCDAPSDCRSSAGARGGGRRHAGLRQRRHECGAQLHRVRSLAACIRKTPFFMWFVRERKIASGADASMRRASTSCTAPAASSLSPLAHEKKLRGIVDRPKNRD